MSNTSINALARHTAVGPLAGYLYQIQRAILRLFDLQEGEALGLEILDDLHVEQNAVATELVQVKHHLSGHPPHLTDASPELWKTLGTWAAAIVDGSLDLSTVQKLVLITNATISSNTLAEMLAKGEDVDLIISNCLPFRKPPIRTYQRP